MFDNTLEAQGLHAGEKRLGTLSAAALFHLGIGLAILAVTAVIVPPVHTPQPAVPVFVIPTQIPLGDLAPHPTAPAPKKGTNAAKPGAAVVPARAAPDVPPAATPTTLQNTASDTAPDGPDGPGVGTPGDPNGSENGVIGGTGEDDGGGGGDRGAEPVYVTGDMVRPVLLVRVEPEYPRVARQAGLAGRVTVRAVIGEDGGVESAEVFASTNPLFDASALDAVRRWRYRPASMNGRPVRVYFTVVVSFLVR